MRTGRIIRTGIVITMIAVGYVHQHVEIVKTGYQMQKNRQYLSYLHDQNAMLMYNLSRLESPKSLLASMNADNIEFANHRVNQTGRYRLASVDESKTGSGDGLVGKFLDLFTLKAEARTRE